MSGERPVVRTLRGKRFLITGKVSVGNREEAFRLAKAMDARPPTNNRSRLTENTDLLIRGDKHPSDDADERKLQEMQARGHRILMIDDAGFCSLLKGGWAYAVQPFGQPIALPVHTAPYRPATADAAIEPAPTMVDLVASTNAHNSFQNGLAERALTSGFVALRSTRPDARYDLGWEDGATLVVVEVKSLRGTNRANQMRLGLGQVLDYDAKLRRDRSIRAVLAVDGTPPDADHWDALCSEHGVTLVWPDVLDRIFPTAQGRVTG